MWEKMKRWLEKLSLCLILAGFAVANDVELVLLTIFLSLSNSNPLIDLQKRDDANRQRCSGMYSRKSWGGNTDPYILVKFRKTDVEEGTDPLVSLVMFEWNDEELIGRRPEGEERVGGRAVFLWISFLTR